MGVSRLVRILGVCVLAVGLMLINGPASAQPGYGSGGPTVSLSASASNGEITVTGAGFEPGETVTGTVFSSPQSIGTQIADSSGRVTFSFSVRDLDLDPGRHRLVLSAPSGSVTVFFTVLGNGGDDDGTIVDVSDSSDDSSDSSSDDSSSDDSSSNDSSSDDSSSDNSSSGGSSSDDSSSGSSSSDDSATGSSSSDGSSSGGLAFTGSNIIVPLSVVAGLLLIGGGAAVAASRRKREKTRV